MKQNIAKTPVNQCRFSPCREYRYVLEREFDAGAGCCAFIGLNPSTADEYQNDPTVSRCMNRGREWGFRRFIMLNAFAYRATDPRDMQSHPEPVGAENDRWILASCKRADRIVCCWGNHAQHLQRSAALFEMLSGYALHRLGRPTAAGEPRHPLYLPKIAALEIIEN